MIPLFLGKYPAKPDLPAVPGNEGCAEVIACGKNVNGLQVGDKVIPIAHQSGTWRTHALIEEHNLLKVPSSLDPVAAATITVNPPTAYRMLRDFVNLKPGDTVIQNGANSAVGEAVFQLCKIWGFRCVGVVRDRPNINELVAFLKELGATEVLTEEQLRTTQLFKSKQLPRPKLAFNCVGGKSATEIIRHLDDKGILVTYGAMSREPVTAPNAALIFKDISFRGFWMSRWTKENVNTTARTDMIQELFEMILKGQLKAPVHKLIPFDQYESALSESLNIKGFAGAKHVFDFRNSSLSSKI